MNTESVYTTIQHIDKQLSKLKLIESNKPVFESLMELRNKMLLEYKPDPKLNWTFKNKKLLAFFNFEVKWVGP
jgi:hypothetical protein